MFKPTFPGFPVVVGAGSPVGASWATVNERRVRRRRSKQPGDCAEALELVATRYKIRRDHESGTDAVRRLGFRGWRRMYGLRHAFVPPKISAEQPEHRVTGRLVGSFRSIDDHLALHNDDCTGYSAIIRDRGDRAATSEQQGCAESGCIHHLTEVSSHSRSPLSARSSSPLRCFSVRSLRRRGDLDPDQLLEAEIMPPVYPLPPLLAPPHHCKLCARGLSPG